MLLFLKEHVVSVDLDEDTIQPSMSTGSTTDVGEVRTATNCHSTSKCGTNYC